MTFRTTTVLTSLALGLLCMQACGGDDKTKKAFAPDAGVGGEGGQGGEPQEDASTGDAMPDVVDEPEPDAGPDAAPDADAGGPAPLELLFTVAAGATGLEGT